MRIGERRRFGGGARGGGESPAWRVLVVDDDEGVREYVEAVLARQGLQVATASSGEEALEQVQRSPPDLVTLDVVLPGIDGLETLRRLKRAHPDMPVILLSAHAPARTSADARRLGASDFLRKPFEPDALERCVSRALSPDAGAAPKS